MDKLLFVISSSFCMLLSFAFVQAVQDGCLVTQVPGFNGVFPSKHYSGYVAIGEQKNLYYYFVESERNPSKDAVVLWLNGGPGCSSFDGFVYEHGPFNFEEGKPKGSLPILHLNPYSWSKVSNIIYLDSPAGVGYSYSKNASAYKTGDIQTAADLHAFLLKWFYLYPEFVPNPFYISGESYAGVYVPTLASEVVKGIQAGAKPPINFKGYMVGNGVTASDFDANAYIPFVHGMALISDDLFKEVEAACGGNYSNPAKACNQTYDKVSTALEDLNFYNILQPCFHNPTAQLESKGNTSLPVSFLRLGVTERPLPVRTRMFGKDGIVPLLPEQAARDSTVRRGLAVANTVDPEPAGPKKKPVPCYNDEVATIWLNDPAVRKAIHAEPENVAGPWDLCTSRISYNPDAGSMIPYHKNLTLQGYRALIYSGDHDLSVPYTGTQAWTKSLGYKTIIPWRSWLSNGDVAGFLQGYDHDLTFLTIKGAGHTVPEYKPREALDFYSRWLDGRPI